MLFVGLVRASDWERPDDTPVPRPRATWRIPWRTLGWFAAVCALLFLAPVADHAFGGLVAYAVILLAVTLGLWRVERWCARQYWHGLREYRA
jgi:energy-coupling factor transporter transmembrane protein EcfT